MSEGTTGRAEGRPMRTWDEWDRRWATLSPFARAAVCVSVARHCASVSDNMHDLGDWAGSGGLARRTRHCIAASEAARLLAGLVGTLCREADDECAALLGEPKDGDR